MQPSSDRMNSYSCGCLLPGSRKEETWEEKWTLIGDTWGHEDLALNEKGLFPADHVKNGSKCFKWQQENAISVCTNLEEGVEEMSGFSCQALFLSQQKGKTMLCCVSLPRSIARHSATTYSKTLCSAWGRREGSTLPKRQLERWKKTKQDQKHCLFEPSSADRLVNYYISEPHSNANSRMCQEQISLSVVGTSPQKKAFFVDIWNKQLCQCWRTHK